MLAVGRDNRLVVNVPPGSMKTLLMSIFWPAWEWGPCGMAHHQFIATTFREDLTVAHSRLFLQLVNSDWYQSRWPIKLTQTSSQRVANSLGGFRWAIPFRSLTGGRADRIIVDDPHSVTGAESESERTTAVLNFRASATQRLNDPAKSAIVVIMQRLNRLDLSGMIIDELKLPYTHIMLPMKFEIERACVTPWGEDRRKVDGELLFPERFTQEVVDRDELAMGSVDFAGQHQQRPTPRGGALFKRAWFKVVDAVPEGCKWVRGWDLAASEGKSAAWTCGVLVGRHAQTRHFYVKHVLRVRVGNPESTIVNMAGQDGKAVIVDIPQDPGASGKIQARSLVGALAGYSAYCTTEDKTKELRAMPVAAQAEAGNISIVRGNWNETLFSELETFPAGYKDQVDGLSRAFARLIQDGSGNFIAPMLVSAPRTYFGDHPGWQ